MARNLLQITEADTEQDLEKDLEDALEPNCRVLIHNDDVTPSELVIMILLRIFQLELIEAESITFIAHTSGIAHVITLPCPLWRWSGPMN